MLGSAAAETSAIARRAQPVFTEAWKLGRAIAFEHPEPAPLHAASLIRAPLDETFSEVPPTAVT